MATQSLSIGLALIAGILTAVSPCIAKYCEAIAFDSPSRTAIANLWISRRVCSGREFDWDYGAVVGWVDGGAAKYFDRDAPWVRINHTISQLELPTI